MNRAAFYAALRKRESGVFGTSLRQAQVDGLERLLSACNDRPISHVAYLLATAYHETARTMQPIMERGSGDGPDADPWDDYLERYDTGRLAKALGNTPESDGDGVRYAGRGYVQLTGLTNYKRASALVGIDLVSNPTLAMHPETAAKILVEGCEAGLFTGARLSQYLPGDYVGARRVVNGTDRAQLIAGYARAFERALQAAGYSVTARTPAAPTSPPTAGPRAENAIVRNPVAWLLSLIGGGLALWMATIKGEVCAVGWIAWLFSTACGG